MKDKFKVVLFVAAATFLVVTFASGILFVLHLILTLICIVFIILLVILAFMIANATWSSIEDKFRKSK